MTSPAVVSNYVKQSLEAQHLKWAAEIVLEYMNPQWRVFSVSGDTELREWDESLRSKLSLGEWRDLRFEGNRIRFQTPALRPFDWESEVTNVIQDIVKDYNIQDVADQIYRPMWEESIGHRIYDSNRNLYMGPLEVAECQRIPCVISFMVWISLEETIRPDSISYWMKEEVEYSFPFITSFV